MHICFLTNEYPKEGYTHGGIGTYVQTLAKKLIMLGHSVSVLGVYNSNKDEVENDCGVKMPLCVQTVLFSCYVWFAWTICDPGVITHEPWHDQHCACDQAYFLSCAEENVNVFHVKIEANVTDWSKPTYSFYESLAGSSNTFI